MLHPGAVRQSSEKQDQNGPWSDRGQGSQGQLALLYDVPAALPSSPGWDQQPSHSNPEIYSSTSQKPVTGSLVPHPAPPCLGLTPFVLSACRAPRATWGSLESLDRRADR